jgi:hypothetical protein
MAYRPFVADTVYHSLYSSAKQSELDNEYSLERPSDFTSQQHKYM